MLLMLFSKSIPICCAYNFHSAFAHMFLWFERERARALKIPAWLRHGGMDLSVHWALCQTSQRPTQRNVEWEKRWRRSGTSQGKLSRVSSQINWGTEEVLWSGKIKHLKCGKQFVNLLDLVIQGAQGSWICVTWFFFCEHSLNICKFVRSKHLGDSMNQVPFSLCNS